MSETQFGITAVEAGIPEKDSLRTRGLVAATAMPAVAADVAVGRGGNEIAAAKLAHLRAQFLDPSCHLVAENYRHLHAAAQRAVAHHHVLATHPAGSHRD